MIKRTKESQQPTAMPWFPVEQINRTPSDHLQSAHFHESRIASSNAP